MRSRTALLIFALCAFSAFAAPDKKAWTAAKLAKASAEDLAQATVDLETDLGTITISFYPEAAPNHVRNFLTLAASGFYDGTKFHRVIPDFMIQGGDPNTISGPVESWGAGGSPKTLKAEFNDIPHERGIVSMARTADPNSATSQFFICVADARYLDHQYTVFGRVVSGMDVVDKIVSAPRNRDDLPDNPIAIKHAKVWR